MLRAAALVMICMIAAAPAAAQTKTTSGIVDRITTDYQAIEAKIAEVKKGGEVAKDADIVLSELIVNKGGHTWPAVGAYRAVYRFWYGWVPGHPFPTNLRKVEVETRSGSLRFYQEYFYGTDGRLRFYRERVGRATAPSGKGVSAYFASEKLVRMVSGDTVNDTPTPGERKTAEVFIRHAQRLMSTFKTALGIRGK